MRQGGYGSDWTAMREASPSPMSFSLEGRENEVGVNAPSRVIQPLHSNTKRPIKTIGLCVVAGVPAE